MIYKYWVNILRVRIFKWENGDEKFGIYACSPENSSFKETFTNMEITECKCLAHDGQQSDEE